MKKGLKREAPNIADSDSFENHLQKLICVNESDIMNLFVKLSMVYDLHTLGLGEKSFSWISYGLANLWPILVLFQSNSL